MRQPTPTKNDGRALATNSSTTWSRPTLKSRNTPSDFRDSTINLGENADFIPLGDFLTW